MSKHFQTSAERKRGVASLRAGIIDDIGKMASQLRGDGEAQTGRPLFPGSSSGSSSLSWSDLRREAIVTPTGNAIEENKRYVNTSINYYCNRKKILGNGQNRVCLVVSLAKSGIDMCFDV